MDIQVSFYLRIKINCLYDSHQDLRKQHDEQVSVYKEELEQTFKAKVRK